MRPGRKPAVAKLIEGLSGSEYAKKRLESLIGTLAGDLTLAEACEQTDIKRTRFCDLRRHGLQELLEFLEPRPAGRPPQAPEKSAREVELEEENARLRLELKATEVRAELDRYMPLLGQKKTKP